MSIITVADLQDELPELVLTTASAPTIAQVTKYIAEIEDEVRGALSACFAPWPVDPTSIDASYMQQLILEGVKYKTLRARFWLSSAEATPPEVARCGKEYQTRLGSICDIAKALREFPGGETPEATYPGVDMGRFAPSLYGSFEQYTFDRAMIDFWRALNNPGPLGLPVPWERDDLG